jgi:hypothetical protein
MRRSSAIRTALTLAAAPIATGLLALTLACNSGANASADVEKAQIAVRANPSLELVATDDRQGVLTVRVRRSGRVMTVSVADVISGVAFRDIDSDPPAAARTNGQGGGNAGSSRVAVSTPNGQVSVDRSRNGVAVSTPEGQVAVRQSGNGVAVSTPDNQVAVRQSGGGVGAATTERDPNARRAGSSGVNVATPDGNVAVRQSGNGVKVETPDTQVGVKQRRDGSLAVSTPDTKVSVGADGIRVQDRAAEPPPARRAPAGGSSQPDPSGKGANIDDARLEQLTRPVSCTATGTENLVGVLLRVDGIAVSTVGGCRIIIRNSHIIGDTAIRAMGSSTVTIENSIVEGRVALQLQGSVNMSVQSSTLRGAINRVGDARLSDLGNNLGLR